MADKLSTHIGSASWRALLLLSGALSACTGVASDGSPTTNGTGPTGNGSSGSGSSGSGSVGIGSSGNGSSGDGSTSVGGGSTGASGGSGSTTACSALAPVPRRLWRLSVEQYQAALKDLLQLPAAPQLSNRGGEAQWAFFSDVALQVGVDFQYALYQAVETAMPQVPAALTACQSTETPTACAKRIATDFGAKAFRRPLTAQEIAALVSNPAQPASGTTAAVSQAPFLAGGSDTQAGIKLMLEAILLSPSFSYRTELGASTPDASGNSPNTTLTPYEVAAQLGFTFLGSTPDAALEAAAADPSSNGLGSMTGINAQLDRLLALPSVQQNLSAIIAGWFNIGQLFSKSHDASFLSALPSADQQDQSGVQADLYSAAEQLITDTFWTKPGKISDLLNSQQGFFNSRLAALYPEVTFPNGRPTSLTTFVRGTWPASENRVGLLSDPSYFWAQSEPAANSIVLRGKAIHDDIICADPLPPKPDLSSAASVAALAVGDSEITHSDARLATSPCLGCHQQMDVYSRVFQHFDPIGAYRALDEVGRAIDTSETFVGTSPLAGQTVAGPTEFAQALSASGHVSGCAVQKMSSYLIGTMIQSYNTCEVQTIRDQFAKTDGTLSSLFRTVMVADFVRNRAGGTQ